MPFASLQGHVGRTGATLTGRACRSLPLALLLLTSACSSGGPRTGEQEPVNPLPGALAGPQATSGPVGCAPLGAGDRLAILERLNAERARPRRCGSESFAATGPLVWDSRLEAAAAGHSRDMARNDFFDHTGSDKLTSGRRAIAAGYDYHRIGENIAAGQQSEEEALDGWLTSVGHCSNIMEPAFRDTALACVANPNSRLGRYWTQVFAVER